MKSQINKRNIVCIFALVTSFFITSCSNLLPSLNDNSTEFGDIVLYLPETSNNSRTALNINDIKIYDFILTNYHGQEIVKLEKIKSSSTVTFSEIPVGIYTLEGKAYSSDGTLFAQNTIKISITFGTNNIPFTFETNIAFALYSKSHDDTNCYNLNIYTVLDPVNPIATNIKAQSYAFDSNQDLYTLYYDNVTHNYEFRKYLFSNKYKSYTNISKIIDMNITGESKLFITEDDYLFTFTHTSSDLNNICVYDNEKEEFIKVEGSSDFVFSVNYYDTNFFDTNETMTPIAITKFQYVNKDYQLSKLYYVDINLDETETYFEIKAFNITRKDNGIDPIEYQIASDDGLTSNIVYFNDIGLDYSNNNNPLYDYYQTYYNFYLFPTDLYFYNNTLCLTLSNKSNDTDSIEINGGSVDLKLLNGVTLLFDLQSNGTFNPKTVKKIGFSTTVNKYQFTYQHYIQGPNSSNENKAFYGPTRILAIKSKKAWIADDGIFLTGETKKDNTDPEVLNKHRLVVLDLETQTFENVYNINETLENLKVNFSGSGY